MAKADYRDLTTWGECRLRTGDLDYPPIVILSEGRVELDERRARVEACEAAILRAWLDGRINLRGLRLPEMTQEVIPLVPSNRRSFELTLKSRSVSFSPIPGHTIVWIGVEWCWTTTPMQAPRRMGKRKPDDKVLAEIEAIRRAELAAKRPFSSRDTLSKELSVSREQVSRLLQKLPKELHAPRGRPRNSPG
jgi:hypothetical protein